MARNRKDNENFFRVHFIRPFKRFLGLTEKEVRTLLNDKAAMLITFAIPLVVILILTVGVNQELHTAEESGAGTMLSSEDNELDEDELPLIGIVDFDNSEGFPDRDLSAELMADFEREEELGNVILTRSTNQTDLEMMIGRGEINAFIVIPNLFEFNLSIHLPAILPFVLDSVNVLGLEKAQAVVDRVIQNFRIKNNFTGVFNVQKTNVNLPEKAHLYFAAAPFFIPSILFAIGCLTSTQAIVSDIPKDRMVLTPTNKKEMMAAKVTANQIIMLLLSLMIIIISAIVGLEIRSTWFEFFLVCFIISLNAVLFGVAISAISPTPLSAFQYFIFLLLFQVIMIVFIEDLLLLAMLPVYNSQILILNVVLRGQSIWSVREYLLNLIYESLIIYIGAYFVFKHQKTML